MILNNGEAAVRPCRPETKCTCQSANKRLSRCVCVCVCTPHVVSRVKEGMTGGTMARHQLKGKHQVFYSSSSLYVSIKPELGKENLLLNPLPSC